MTSIRSFKQGVSKALGHWEENQYALALVEVEELLRTWPGNAQLYIMWASLVQLQEDPGYSLAEVKKALQQAVEVDKNSPSAAIELGHFLDAVEDNPQAASKFFAEGILSARRLMIDGLLGQVRALLQLSKREEALRCLMEALYLADVDHLPERGKSADAAPDIILRDLNGRIQGLRLKGPFASKIEELLEEFLPNRSA